MGVTTNYMAVTLPIICVKVLQPGTARILILYNFASKLLTLITIFLLALITRFLLTLITRFLLTLVTRFLLMLITIIPDLVLSYSMRPDSYFSKIIGICESSNCAIVLSLIFLLVS